MVTKTQLFIPPTAHTFLQYTINAAVVSIGCTDFVNKSIVYISLRYFLLKSLYFVCVIRSSGSRDHRPDFISFFATRNLHLTRYGFALVIIATHKLNREISIVAYSLWVGFKTTDKKPIVIAQIYRSSVVFKENVVCIYKQNSVPIHGDI
jgi:hypothetical protein